MKLGRFGDFVAYRQASLICDWMRLDIERGTFAAKNNEELAAIYGAFPPARNITPLMQPSPKPFDLAAALRNRLEKKYHNADQSLLNLLERYGKPIRDGKDAERFVRWLEDGRKAATVQRYLNSLKAICPLFRAVKVRSNEDSEPPDPFTKREVNLILGWFQRHPDHCFYYDFICCMFWTGMRVSECIGLRWQCVDFEQGILVISESTPSPKRNAERRRTKTKTGKIRRFPLSGELLEMLQRRSRDSRGELVFPSPTGKMLNDSNFSQKQWRMCLDEVGVRHRKFSCTRHTFISHYLAQTGDIAMVASLTHASKSGIQTILNHYAWVISAPDPPRLFD